MSASEKKTRTLDAESLDESDAEAIVDALCEAREALGGAWSRTLRNKPLPSREVVIAAVEELRAALFPGYFGSSEITDDSIRFQVSAALERALRLLRQQVQRGLHFVCPKSMEDCADCRARALDVIGRVQTLLPEIQRQLFLDAYAAYEGDPAAESPDEAVFCYPGMQALTDYRLAHELYRLDVPLLPRMIAEHAHSVTGIDIHPGASIGEGLCIDHGTGIVIGETCVIGRRVRLYQGVTLGAKSFPLNQQGNPVKGIDRHPVIEDDVVVYAGATLLGRITIGQGSVIGGNVWLTRDVPPGSHITQATARADETEE